MAPIIRLTTVMGCSRSGVRGQPVVSLVEILSPYSQDSGVHMCVGIARLRDT